ncbi:hypothetical protein [Rugamonas sp.]|uniref:hypothetical protein n=1 Tax=Rugamonas sp. TaxID=1926287 RepID=UPI0025F41B40|nr:hypothetical protein [Rugamonas sp.]
MPHDLLNAAQEIAAIAKAENTYRAVVNRSYYASYHASIEFRNALPKIGSVGGARGVHEQLIALLLNPHRKLTGGRIIKSKTVGKYLRQLCDLRANADYHLNLSVGEDVMRDAVTLAQSIFDEIYGA